MPEKTCESCGETVDAAKAFCPACGEPFVSEEQRDNVSDFDKLGSTVNLGQTMYNQMLSDMGLDLERPKHVPPQKRVEVIQPAVADVKPAVEQHQPVKPVPQRSVSGTSRRTIWLLVIGGALVLMFLFVMVAAVVIYFAWPMIRQ